MAIAKLLLLVLLIRITQLSDQLTSSVRQSANRRRIAVSSSGDTPYASKSVSVIWLSAPSASAKAAGWNPRPRPTQALTIVPGCTVRFGSPHRRPESREPLPAQTGAHTLFATASSGRSTGPTAKVTGGCARQSTDSSSFSGSELSDVESASNRRANVSVRITTVTA